MVISVKLFESPFKTKKYRAVFYKDGKEWKHKDFGAKGMSDYTIHKDDKRKENYLKRHRARENWRDPYSAGSLARYVLWNKPTLRGSWEDYKRRFNLK